MKSQREIYEALLAGEMVEETQCGYLYKINSSGNLEVTLPHSQKWESSFCSFQHYTNYEIYTPPRIPMTLEVEVTWAKEVNCRSYASPEGFDVIFPDDFAINGLTPFIGKRTKMTLVEILEET